MAVTPTAEVNIAERSHISTNYTPAIVEKVKDVHKENSLKGLSPNLYESLLNSTSSIG